LFLVFFIVIPGGEVDDMGGKEDGVFAVLFWEVDVCIVAHGGDGDFVPKLLQAVAFLAEMFEAFVAMVDEIILAERLVRQMGELAEGKLGLPDGNGLVRAKFGIGGTFNPVEF